MEFVAEFILIYTYLGPRCSMWGIFTYMFPLNVIIVFAYLNNPYMAHFGIYSGQIIATSPKSGGLVNLFQEHLGW